VALRFRAARRSRPPLNRAQLRACCVAGNRRAELAGWNLETLALERQGLSARDKRPVGLSA